MEIIRAKPNEAASLSEIAFAAKRHWGYPEQWMEIWRPDLTVTPDFISNHETYNAVEKSQIVGFYALNQTDRQLDLVHLWVLPNRMGQGVGRLLFSHVLEHAKALEFRAVQIESDPNAEGFYQRMGARRVGVNTHYVEQQKRELPLLISEV